MYFCHLKINVEILTPWWYGGIKSVGEHLGDYQIIPEDGALMNGNGDVIKIVIGYHLSGSHPFSDTEFASTMFLDFLASIAVR